jgi:hypothetical protein
VRSLLGVVVAALALLFAAPALAEDSATERMQAHFANGVKLFDATPPDYDGALAEFRAAYAEKPAWSIKRNIAACLRALRRYPEAIDALEEMLAEGRDQVKPEVREVAEKAITEMSGFIALVRVTVLPTGSKATLTVDDIVVPMAKAGLPLRLGPGDHVLRAHAEGYGDRDRKITVAGGQRHEVTLELVPIVIVARGTLVVRATPATAEIFVDGEEPRAGVWQAEVRAGTHHVVVTQKGYVSFASDVSVPPGELRELPVTLAVEAPPPIPPPPDMPLRPAPRKERVWYGVGGLSLHGGEAKLAPVFEDDSGKKRSFVGVGLSLRLGRQLSRYFSVEGLGELGTMNSDDYFPKSQPNVRATVSTLHWVLAPVVRFHTPGDVKLIAGLGLGVMGQGAQARVGLKEVSGGGVGGMAFFELGMEIQLPRLFVQAVLFGDVHDMSKVKDNAGQTLFDDRSASRAGLRISLGYPF